MEGDVTSSIRYIINYISIHTLRMEGDYFGQRFFFAILISIHTLRMEGDGTFFRIALSR